MKKVRQKKGNGIRRKRDEMQKEERKLNYQKIRRKKVELEEKQRKGREGRKPSFNRKIKEWRIKKFIVEEEQQKEERRKREGKIRK